MIKALTPRAWRSKNRYLSGCTTIDEFLRKSEKASRELELIKGRPPLRRDDIALVTMVRNEAIRLPAFLNHYRDLGVDSFVFIDNDSTDETRKILSEAADVEIWRARDFKKKNLLLTALIRSLTHAYENWVVVADADEFLVYDGMESHDLHDLGDLLDRRSQKRLRAFMVDLYGKGPVRSTAWPSGEPLDAEWFFDSDSYTVKNNEVSGGPRSRMLSTKTEPFNNWLGKFPFGRFDTASGLIHIHEAYPYHLNAVSNQAAMAHLKFTSDFVSLVDRAVMEKQYLQDAMEYRIYQEALRQDPDWNLYHDGSRHFRGASSLIETGLIAPIDWHSKAEHQKEIFRHRLHVALRGLQGPGFAHLRRTRRSASNAS